MFRIRRIRIYYFIFSGLERFTFTNIGIRLVAYISPIGRWKDACIGILIRFPRASDFWRKSDLIPFRALPKVTCECKRRRGSCENITDGAIGGKTIRRTLGRSTVNDNDITITTDGREKQVQKLIPVKPRAHTVYTIILIYVGNRKETKKFSRFAGRLGGRERMKQESRTPHRQFCVCVWVCVCVRVLGRP